MVFLFVAESTATKRHEYPYDTTTRAAHSHSTPTTHTSTHLRVIPHRLPAIIPVMCNAKGKCVCKKPGGSDSQQKVVCQHQSGKADGLPPVHHCLGNHNPCSHHHTCTHAMETHVNAGKATTVSASASCGGAVPTRYNAMPVSGAHTELRGNSFHGRVPANPLERQSSPA